MDAGMANSAGRSSASFWSDDCAIRNAIGAVASRGAVSLNTATLYMTMLLRLMPLWRMNLVPDLAFLGSYVGFNFLLKVPQSPLTLSWGVCVYSTVVKDKLS